MDQSVARGASGLPRQGSTYPSIGSGKAGNDSVGNAFGSGRDSIASSASTAADNASSELDSLRADFNGLKDTVAKFVSEASDQASKSVREVSQAVAGQVGDGAAWLAESGANLASAATGQAKSFASELEGMGRRNPLGAMAGALLVGVFIGLIGRSRS